MHHAEGIVLAAGSSRRAGSFKPAMILESMPMIRRCMEGMRAVCSRIIVVGGHDMETMRGLVNGIPGVECVENLEYLRGMFTSVKVGVARVRSERFFILPADVPLVPAAVYLQMLLHDAPVAIPAYRGRRGHPVLLHRSTIPIILAEPDDSSLGRVFQRCGAVNVEVDAEEILLDVDTPEDYQALSRRTPGKN